MWTTTHRETYGQSGMALPSDLTDAQWERLAPLIPAAKPGGRPRGTDMRAAMNALFYLLRTGCPWRYLPRGPFTPRSTVYNIFRNFQRAASGSVSGTNFIWRCAKRSAGRPAQPPRSSTARASRARKKILWGWTAARLGRLSFHTSMEATDAVRHLRDRCRGHRPGE